MWNPFHQRLETRCHLCDTETTDLYVATERDDGSRYERTDGSFGRSDLYLCQNCLEEYLAEATITAGDVMDCNGQCNDGLPIQGAEMAVTDDTGVVHVVHGHYCIECGRCFEQCHNRHCLIAPETDVCDACVEVQGDEL